MILGQSIFDAVLTRLRDEADAAAPAPDSGDGTQWKGVSGLNMGFIGAAYDGADTFPASHFADAYRDFSDDDAPKRPPEAPQNTADISVFKRLTPQEIAEDMGLSAQDTAEQLQAKRREFARRNHPDLVNEALRDAANMRMKIANLLVDEALRRFSGK